MDDVRIYKCAVDALTDEGRARQLKEALLKIPGCRQVDVNVEKRLARIVCVPGLDVAHLKQRLAPLGFHLREAAPVEHPQTDASHSMSVSVDGMTCKSCEILIERAWTRLPGVQSVDVNAHTGKAALKVAGEAPTLAALQAALGGEKYRVRRGDEASALPTKRPSLVELAGLFAVVLLVAWLFGKLGVLKPNVSFAAGASFWTVFVVGLLAASTSCIAVSGGLLLSSAAAFNERYRSVSAIGRLRPVLLFLTGRIASYAFFGGVIGLVGRALTPSPAVTGLITIAAAAYMLAMGLDMLHLAPGWLKRLTPKLPKSLARRALRAEQVEHPLTPLLLGGATFFLPCGFTQALQLYALTTGSFARGATLLLAFALGTAPALFALGWASSSLKGKAGQWFFKLSGAFVVMLGLWNIQNGLFLAGLPLSWPSFSFPSAPTAVAAADPSVTFDGGTQVIRMTVDEAYEPDSFTIKAGVPTRWEIDGKDVGGCISVLISPQLGIQKLLQPGPNTIQFTAPTQPGTYPFSCSMGMFRGTIRVVSNT